MFDIISWFYWVIVICLIIIISLLVMLIKAGVFNEVIVSTGIPNLGKIYIAYKYQKGEYKDSSQLISEVHSINSKAKCFGLFYDDPKITEVGKKRFAIACILGDQESNIDKNLENLFKKHNFNTMWLPKIDNAVLCEFPLLNYAFMLSIIVSIFKVYPVLEKFIKKNKLCAHPYIEMYLDDRIEYIVPLSQQSKFYVEEYNIDEYNDEYYQKRKLANSNNINHLD